MGVRILNRGEPPLSKYHVNGDGTEPNPGILRLRGLLGRLEESEKAGNEAARKNVVNSLFVLVKLDKDAAFAIVRNPDIAKLGMQEFGTSLAHEAVKHHEVAKEVMADQVRAEYRAVAEMVDGHGYSVGYMIVEYHHDLARMVGSNLHFAAILDGNKKTVLEHALRHDELFEEPSVVNAMTQDISALNALSIRMKSWLNFHGNSQSSRGT